MLAKTVQILPTTIKNKEMIIIGVELSNANMPFIIINMPAINKSM